MSSPRRAIIPVLLTGLVFGLQKDALADDASGRDWSTSLQCELDASFTSISRWGGTLSLTIARPGNLTLRPSLDFDITSESGHQTEAPNPFERTDRRTTDDDQTFYVSLGVRTQPPSVGVKFLAGIGPMAGYSHSKWTREVHMQTYNSSLDSVGGTFVNWYDHISTFNGREVTSWILGLRGEIGVEWVISRRFGIIAELAFWPQYSWSRIQSTSGSGPPEPQARQSAHTTEQGLLLWSGSKFGLCINID